MGPNETLGWQRVLVDRPEHLPVVVAKVAGDGENRLMGFSFQPAGWTLQTAEPAFILSEGAAEELPELWQEPNGEAWRRAWQQWCQQRGVSPTEDDTCRLQAAGAGLQVLAAPPLLDRLRGARGGIAQAEAWLLAGTGRLRTAALVEISETPTPPAEPQ
jgi:hypothetical protein